ncbi:hypothetical protein [Bosea sp. 685]|uniref:hypothetical protein n=1 Tax=Bosea sp. 685 TaxID=3080057 RepID=UPI0028934918|nr:hypothetical protein [Bosea sp. 685]WNJ90140.1 hypothetical protein RMR04_27755 [Bosea sp. 685]
MSQPASIHMGHGQMVDIVARDAGQWEIVFSEAGVPDYKAPPLNEVEVDAIDIQGRIHPLAISASGSVSSVLASGHVEGAYRVRMRVVHGTHFHTRESLLPGAAALPPKLGGQGGALVTLDGGLDAEVKRLDETRWEISFLKGGAVVAPPPAESVVVQAIGPRAEDYQIRNLATEPGQVPATLIASGKIKDATHARLTIKSEVGEQIRGFPIVSAA